MIAEVLVVIFVILAVALGAFWLSARRGRTQRLQDKFGPEYARALNAAGNRDLAEKELSSRERRVQELQIRDLEADERQDFASAWQSIQGRFIDDPINSMQDADLLVLEVMAARGYQVRSFLQMAADISVNHAAVVRNYRAAHAIAEADAKGLASTEDLRQAMIHYRALFADLLGEPVGALA